MGWRRGSTGSRLGTRVDGRKNPISPPHYLRAGFLWDRLLGQLYTKVEFREVFEKKAADILNPDVGNCGGILELKEIAAMAEPHLVTMSPHNYNSTTVALAATVHACAVMSNFLITEYFVNFTERGDEISVNPIKAENGYIQLPTGPGLGIELDEAAMGRHPYQAFPKRNLPRYSDEKL